MLRSIRSIKWIVPKCLFFILKFFILSIAQESLNLHSTAPYPFLSRVSIKPCVHGPRNRSEMKKELTNRNGHVIKLFKCDLLIFSLFEISDQFLAS